MRNEDDGSDLSGNEPFGYRIGAMNVSFGGREGCACGNMRRALTNPPSLVRKVNKQPQQ
jgi:hypothetical protein